MRTRCDRRVRPSSHDLRNKCCRYCWVASVGCSMGKSSLRVSRVTASKSEARRGVIVKAIRRRMDWKQLISIYMSCGNVVEVV